MQEIIFRKNVSKGSRFNQIYIPKHMENIVEIGDLVQVKLLKKHTFLQYKGLIQLSEFKEYLIKNIFSNLQRFSEIEAIFIVGSFLFETLYNDIDVVLIINNAKEGFEEKVKNDLEKEFSQRFHILIFSDEKVRILIERDPLTRAMFTSYIANKKAGWNYKKTVDNKHIEFLLMMPEDLLELILPSKIYYDNIRRLITIEEFLKDKALDRETILHQIKKEMEAKLLYKIRDNKGINDKEINILRGIIKEKITRIRMLIKDGKKG